MINRLAHWAAGRAHERMLRLKTVRSAKRAWFWRELASWLRGGEWTAFPGDRELRQNQPRADFSIEWERG